MVAYCSAAAGAGPNYCSCLPGSVADLPFLHPAFACYFEAGPFEAAALAVAVGTDSVVAAVAVAAAWIQSCQILADYFEHFAGAAASVVEDAASEAVVGAAASASVDVAGFEAAAEAAWIQSWQTLLAFDSADAAALAVGAEFAAQVSGLPCCGLDQNWLETLAVPPAAAAVAEAAG